MIRIARIKKLSHSYKNIKRYKEILQVLIKYGFGNKLKAAGLYKFIHKGKIPIREIGESDVSGFSTPEKLRMVLAELGPTFIKLGQILATRPDLVPVEYTKEFYKLQDDAPHFSYGKVKKIFKEETGKEPEEIFDSFNKEPLAAASIGQVHKAVYKGVDVVVKVQRPDITRKITSDLEIIYHLAHILEKHIYEVMLQKPTEIVMEFKKSLEKELDFTIELSQTKRFAEDFKDDPTVYVPKTYPEVSTSRILVLEFINGIKLHNRKRLNEEGYDLKLLGERGTDAYLRQMFINGYFHADPHPGNIFIMPNNVFCFIDFGMMGKISVQERSDFAWFLLNITKKRGPKIVKSILKFTTYEEEPDREALQRDLADIIDECLLHPMGNVSFGSFVEGLMEVLTDHCLRIRPNMFLLMKSLASIETVAYDLDPDLHFVDMSGKYVQQIAKQRFSKEKIFYNLTDAAEDYLKLIYEFPETAHILLKQAKLGKMKLNVHLEQKKTREAIDRLSMRIAVSVILAALLISHSLTMLLPKTAVGHVLRAWGTFGFIVTALLGFYLLFSLLRKHH